MAVLVSSDNAVSVYDKLINEPVLSLDTETSGLEWGDRPFLAILATATEEFLFPIGQDNTFLARICATPRKWIFQNAKFDCRMLRQMGIRVHGEIYDDAIASRLLRNDYFGAKPYSLEAQAKRHGMVKQFKEVDDAMVYEERTTRLGEKYKAKRYDRVDKEIMYRYAAMDARITYDLFHKYTASMDSQTLRVLDNESRLHGMCMDMEWRGIQTDPAYARRAMDYERAALVGVAKEFEELTGIAFADKKSVLIPIFEAAGERITYTDKDNPQLRDEDLERFTSPAAHLVQRIRGHQKLISTYYENIINRADDDGILRAAIWQAGTKTGRFSYSEPNLQNLPKDEESTEAYVVRGAFVPRAGRVFVSMDYAQQEYRLMLAYANQRDLIDKVMAGADLHEATADIVGITRSHAKTLNFAILYGAGVAKIAKMLGVTEIQASRLKADYFKALPNVEALIERVIRTGRARGFVRNWFGRKLYADREYCYALPNHIMQGGGADVIKRAMVQMWEAGLIHEDNFAVVQIHDQLVFDCKPEAFDSLAQIQDIMQRAFPPKNGMSLTVDVSWSDKSLAVRDMVGGFPDGSRAPD